MVIFPHVYMFPRPAAMIRFSEIHMDCDSVRLIQIFHEQFALGPESWEAR